MDALRVASVPPPPGPRDEVRRLAANEGFIGVILSRDFWGVWTHWDGNRSLPCHAEKSKCEGCQAGLPARWKGYLHVIVGHGPEDCFLELTPSAADALLKAIPKGTEFRGLVLNAQRGRGAKARLKVSINPGKLDASQLPEGKDPEPVLRALWNMPRRHGSSLHDPRSRFSRLDEDLRL